MSGNEHEEQVRQIGELLTAADWIVAGGDPVVGVRGLLAEVARLTPLAAEGEQYRADLVAEALAEGVRAYGKQFDEATYRKTLEAAPLATIKRFTADWSEIAGKRFPGGRQTTDAKSPRPEPERAAVVPDSHYAG